MKKTILTIFAVMIAAISFAQPFSLVVDGFRSTDDKAKDYIVISAPDCNKAALFQKAKNYFTVKYNSPQNVLSESGTDAISILGMESISYSAGRMGRTTAYFKYKFVVEIREGRIKVTPTWISLYDDANKYEIQSKGLMLGIYRKNGELRDDKAKAQIEEIINGLTSGLEAALKQTNTPASEDW